MEQSFSNDTFVALDRVLSLLKGVRKSTRGWIACCPAHQDRHPSLSIALGKEESVLLKCHAGCSFDAIVEALGLTPADLFVQTPTKQLFTSKYSLSSRLSARQSTAVEISFQHRSG